MEVAFSADGGSNLQQQERQTPTRKLCQRDTSRAAAESCHALHRTLKVFKCWHAVGDGVVCCFREVLCSTALPVGVAILLEACNAWGC